MLSGLVAELHQEWNQASWVQKAQIYRENQLTQWEKVEASPPELFQTEMLGEIPWGKVAKWTGIGALTAVAGFGLLRWAPVALGAAARGVGMVAGLVIRGGAVAVPALWKWSTVSGWRALGVSLAILFSSQWAYSKIVGKKSLIEIVVDKSGDIVRAVPGTLKSGIILAVVLFGAMALYNYSKKGKTDNG